MQHPAITDAHGSGGRRMFLGLRPPLEQVRSWFHTARQAFGDASALRWLAPEDVKSGDRVVVYTKSGQDSFQLNEDGSKTYFRYWGLNSPIFVDQNNGIVVANVSDWSVSRNV